MSTTKYDTNVCDVFFNFKEQNLVAKYTEEASLRGILGRNLNNISILDIGCGFGYHSRWLADEGAAVTGFDLSEDQIRKALELESENPKGIRYAVEDAGCLSLEYNHRYDVCLMMYMLQTARDVGELFDYFQNAFWSLKNGGKLLGVFDNCYDSKIVEKYGYKFDKSALRAQPGELFTGESDVDDGRSAFICRQIKVDRNLIENVGKTVGFCDVQWYNPRVSEEGLALKGDEFWHDFVNLPVDQYFVMKKHS